MWKVFICSAWVVPNMCLCLSKHSFGSPVCVTIACLQECVLAYLHRQWLICKGPVQSGRWRGSRSKVLLGSGSNQRSRMNVYVGSPTIELSSRSSPAGTTISPKFDIFKKHTTSPHNAFSLIVFRVLDEYNIPAPVRFVWCFESVIVVSGPKCFPVSFTDQLLTELIMQVLETCVGLDCFEEVQLIT